MIILHIARPLSWRSLNRSLRIKQHYPNKIHDLCGALRGECALGAHHLLFLAACINADKTIAFRATLWGICFFALSKLLCESRVKQLTCLWGIQTSTPHVWALLYRHLHMRTNCKIFKLKRDVFWRVRRCKKQMISCWSAIILNAILVVWKHWAISLST